MSTSAVSTPVRRYRWEEFVALGEDDLRELVDGELLEVEVPTKLHEWIVAGVVTVLTNWAREHGGLVLASGYRVRIREDRGAMPDVQFFGKGRERVGGEQGLEEGHPDLAVEVVSTTSRRYDRVVKLGWYASIGVPEYWIVDPESQTLERLLLDGATYRIAEALFGDAVFRPASFAGLSIPLADLWRMPGDTTDEPA